MNDDLPVIPIVGTLAALVLGGVLAVNLYESVDAGTYHITQNPITGKVAAEMTPGPYNQFFCTVTEWPVSASYEFTDPDADGPTDDRIAVTFNDGATARLSGTIRIDLPRSEGEATDLVVKHGFRSFTSLEDKLILRNLRNVLNMTANLMSSRESYSERRSDFLRLAKDQLENGVYVTKDESYKEVDPVSGTEITKIRKVFVTGADGKPMREPSVFADFGLRAYGLEVKDWHYEERVVSQMKAQQEALMAVQTAKAQSLKAEQQAKTVEAEGKAKVMTVKYEAEQIKEKATVEAQKEAAVAAIASQKEVDIAKQASEKARIEAEKVKTVAQIELDAAKLQAQRTLELAQAEAKSRELILTADGALDKKLEAYKAVNVVWAEAYAKQNVPGIVMGGTAAGRDSANVVMDALGVKAMRDLALDLSHRPAATVPAK
jgi:regulator of protease activity HflC (stomatin/prohibitin superfamily)